MYKKRTQTKLRTTIIKLELNMKKVTKLYKYIKKESEQEPSKRKEQKSCKVYVCFKINRLAFFSLSLLTTDQLKLNLKKLSKALGKQNYNATLFVQWLKEKKRIKWSG
uniref:Uncharacterized protein n=1 Tax=Cacopsylla melanoneura TaxID=428564 RepID=A0A8D9BDJ0_9HEMI